MERILKTNKGYSFAEVMIAMIIMGVVALLMGTILTTSTKMHRSSFSSDDAYAIAREKLAELQNDQIAGLNNGPDYPTRNNFMYTRNWTITQDDTDPTAPVKAVITVSWNQGNLTKNISITGYVNCLVCIPDADNDSGPTIPTLSNNTITKTLGHTKALSGTKVGTISSYDGDVDSGDHIFYSLEANYQDNDSFTISGSDVFLAKDLPVNESLGYKIKIWAKDCQGGTNHKASGLFTVFVKEKVNGPEVTGQKYSIPENSTTGHSVGHIQHDRGEWFYITSTQFELNGDSTSNHIVVTSPTPTLDYESSSNIFLIPIVVKNNAGDSVTTGTDTIVLTNVDEAPTSISCDTDPINITSSASTETILAIFSASDPDTGDNSFEFASSEHVYFDFWDDTLKIKNSPIPVDTYNVTITVNASGKSSLTYDSTIQIGVSAAPMGFEDDHDDGDPYTGPDGLTWTRYGTRNWLESVSKVTIGPGSAPTFLICDYDCQDDGILEVNLKANSIYGDCLYGGIVFRYTNTSSFYFLHYQQSNRNFYLNINQLGNSTSTQIGTASSMGNPSTIKIELSGNNFTFYADDNLVGSITDGTHSSGKVGYGQTFKDGAMKNYNYIKWDDQ